ncbi:MAG TPA: LytTR family DNA-binding domain-containing protein, partial [Gemmatimonadaceae bacterium]|nr:LytTR family DNA-binding domain-containing protein [Gemmatimonadaceae bacterium]
MRRIRTAIADDEPLARERIASMLEEKPDYEIAAVCKDGREAVAAIHTERLDLIFLDVKMPELDGFQVLEALGAGPTPAIIFVTAFDDYALRAFDVSALDYLLKPFDRARFEKTLARFEAQWNGARKSGAAELGVSEELRKFLSELEARNGETYTSRFAVKSNAGIYFIRADDIEWIDSAGNYTALHSGGRKHLIRETIKSVEARLDPRKFVRVHRSAIINLDKLRKLQPYFHGEYVVTMQDGTTLTS